MKTSISPLISRFLSQKGIRKAWVVAGIGALMLGAVFLDARVFGVPTSRTNSKSRGINWHTSFATALAASKTSGKPVMVDFGAKWCGACHQMDQETYPDPKVIAASKGFVMLRVDVDEQPNLAAHYGISSLPTLVWLRSDGKAVVGAVGALEPTDLISAMRQANQRMRASQSKAKA